MIPLSKKLNQWCLHKFGVEPVTNHAGWTKTLASAELNEDAHKIISSFGKKEFEGIVGFIDMRGFSRLSQGKSPTEVHAIVAPFLTAVIETAGKHACFIDKTIGDEVMVVMPWFDEDTVLSDACLPHRKVAMYELTYFIRDLIVSLSEQTPDVRFSAGFALGSLLLDRVGGDQYSEWTVYGNCVNAAKRLQARRTPEEWGEHHVFAVGQLEYELTSIHIQLDIWEKDCPADLKRIAMFKGKEEFKGVGPIIFAHSAIEATVERHSQISVVATP